MMCRIVLISDFKRMLVSSYMLSHASPVFKAMLSPKYQEETELNNSSTSTLEVALPDDDPESISLMCHILHTRNNSVPNYLKLSKILDLARVVDKYDCCEALGPIFF